MNLRDRFYVVSGGLGAGKTTLLEALAKRGYRVIPECARRIISEQMQADDDALNTAPVFIRIYLYI
ncbi:AAA family ATPase [Filimonas effusa]|uniref:NadR/Ttd14 AAA domain-containing protein n=1 Tax=Filimonas effusa TaxID=2508721 RepID=A0A4Q1DD38_9BACT|nr:AAA family ATPase [Filimonas effusa]RXK87300.1 hypothetical protein ESB13_11130 [Filimonas effusa]